MIQNIEKTILKNGNIIISEKMEHLSSISLGLWLCRGSIQESNDETGLSHLYEHMVFKGTKSYTAFDIARSLEKKGGTLNAFTTKEYICFYARFVKEELPIASNVIKELFTSPKFTKEDLEVEKNVVIEEIRSSIDNPEECVHDDIMEIMWPESSLGKPIAGLEDDIKKITLESFTEFCNKMKSTKCIVSAAGNVEHLDLLLLFKELEDIDVNSNIIVKPQTSVIAAKSISKRDILQANICNSVEVMSYKSIDKYPLLILNSVFGEGMSSRLFQNLRESSGLAYSVGSFSELYYSSGMMGIYAGTDPEKLDSLLGKIDEELDLIQKSGISKDEFDFAMDYAVGSLLLSSENPSNRMSRLARMIYYNDTIEYYDKTVTILKAVTLDDVNRISEKYMIKENFSSAIITSKNN